MKGTVHSMNPRRGMVAIETEDSGFTIIELLNDTNIDLGDIMEWHPATAGHHQVYYNHTKGSKMRVYAQNHWLNHGQLRQQLLFD